MNQTIYLDNAATTWPKPESVYQAVDHFNRHMGGNPGRGSHGKTLEAAGILLDAREAVARLLGIPHPSRIAFTKNVTEAINTALRGILNPGDHVIISSMEHNAVARPLTTLSRQGVSVTRVPCASDGTLDPAFIDKSWRKNTRMVCLTAASNVTGTIMPIEEAGRICREKEGIFLVDSAQSAGVIPTHAEKQYIDILAFTGHKALYGPQGTGGFYLRTGINMRPLMEGGTGSLSELTVQPDFMPDQFESGTPNTPGIAGLEAGICYISEKGISVIREHEVKLMDALMDGLSQIKGLVMYGPAASRSRTGVISFNLGDWECGELSHILHQKAGIITRSGLHCAPLAHGTMGTTRQGTCRASIGWFTTDKDIQRLLETLDQLSGS